ncbi:MAG: diguanylate cyclase [Ruminococcaceae bacterium]|nr:diguanylate cyclase [Oscillospiraceae bacterium]
MSKKLSMLRSVISDYGTHLNGARIKEFESEDPLSKNLLRQRLCEVNSRRIIFFTIPAVILSIVFVIINIADMTAHSVTESVFSITGLLLIIVGCGCGGVMVYREYEKRKANLRKIENLISIYWIIFSAAVFLLTVSDFSVNVFAYRFYLYLIIMAAIPLFDLKRTLILICPYLALIIILGCIFGADILVLVLSAVFSFAYLIISSLVYSSFCCLFISDRQLNIANERCRQINEKDGLTGLLNKKGLIRRLNDIIDKGTENNIAAIFFDIDDFRQYNHIYTDAESDECLYNICNCVRIVSKPKTDIISRYGGDEFVIIVQDTTEYDLIYFAEQIRKSVERMALPFEKGKNVTISVGVSSITEGDFSDYSKLLKEAEESLSLAKKGGRNCVGYMGNVFKAN